MTLIGVKSKYGSGWGTSPGVMEPVTILKKKKALNRHNIIIYIRFGSNPDIGI